ncbi:hypothetical protein CYY_000309 [Polysphondylium violaceum]|uniref:Ankyrin repeat-containing protein n=1 Tax=Polysphondylium violaceum TaxID=133409 RepID=A0A8J4Q451_9MYCE|nr:hypothetical protein CYY_000309 [Polysphondylium violaceum]
MNSSFFNKISNILNDNSNGDIKDSKKTITVCTTPTSSSVLNASEVLTGGSLLSTNEKSNVVFLPPLVQSSPKQPLRTYSPTNVGFSFSSRTSPSYEIERSSSPAFGSGLSSPKYLKCITPPPDSNFTPLTSSGGSNISSPKSSPTKSSHPYKNSKNYNNNGNHDSTPSPSTMSPYLSNLRLSPPPFSKISKGPDNDRVLRPSPLNINFDNNQNSFSYEIGVTKYDYFTFEQIPLLLASFHNNIPSLTKMIKCGTDLNYRCRLKGWTPLMFASQEGHLETINLLFESKSIDINIQNYDGETALLIACTHSQKEVVHLLLKNNANPNIGNKEGTTPLMICSCNYKDFDIISLLIEYGANVNLVDNQGFTCLMYCITYFGGGGSGSTNTTSTTNTTPPSQPALPSHQNNNQQRDIYFKIPPNNNPTPPHLVNNNNNNNNSNINRFLPQLDNNLHCKKLVLQLLLDHGVKTDTISKNEWTALTLAIKHGPLDLVSFLIEVDGNASSSPNNNHQHHMVKPQKYQNNGENFLKNSPTLTPSCTIFAASDLCPPKYQRFFEDYQDSQRWSPLKIAIRYSPIEMVDLLLKKAIDYFIVLFSSKMTTTTPIKNRTPPSSPPPLSTHGTILLILDYFVLCIKFRNLQIFILLFEYFIKIDQYILQQQQSISTHSTTTPTPTPTPTSININNNLFNPQFPQQQFSTSSFSLPLHLTKNIPHITPQSPAYTPTTTSVINNNPTSQEQQHHHQLFIHPNNNINPQTIEYLLQISKENNNHDIKHYLLNIIKNLDENF